MKSNKDWTEIDLEALPEDFIPRTSYQPVGDPDRYRRDYGTWRGTDGNPVSVRDQIRLGWRRMAATTGKRTLHAAPIPPGAAHVHPVYSVGPFDSPTVLLGQLAYFASLPMDFLIKSSGSSEIQFMLVGQLAKFDPSSPLAPYLVDRAARLVCTTGVYAEVWESALGSAWRPEAVLRKAVDRRQAEVELDAMVALDTGLSADELCTIYRTQFPVLRGYEQNDLYDANGRKVPGDMNRLYRKTGEKLTLEDRTWTHPQSGVEYVFEFPFRSFDREEDMRKAYTHFENLLGDKS